MRTIGTVIRGLRAPIIKQGDNLVKIVSETVINSAKTERFEIKDKDVIGITESLLARAQGNYVIFEEIIDELKEKFKSTEIGVVFPILSRNRFSMILKAIASGFSKVHVLLSYPADEVGNALMDPEKLDQSGINPYTDFLYEEDYRRIFGKEVKHPFTGIDYVTMYKSLGVNDNISIYFSNNPRHILRFTSQVLVADIHTRSRTKKMLQNAGTETVYGLDDICTKPGKSCGYNTDYGLLGSNMATEEKIKLFPRDGQDFVEQIQARIRETTGKQVEVMVYGDGAFKDPVGKIWELADPVVSPAYTTGLDGTPNEVKIKYLADSLLGDLKDESRKDQMKQVIREKKKDLIKSMESQGTTPRRFTDLLGSLCDLTSGSGDKGTPIVLVQGYFDNYAEE